MKCDPMMWTDGSPGPVAEGKAAEHIKNFGKDIGQAAKTSANAIKSAAVHVASTVTKGATSLGSVLKTNASTAVRSSVGRRCGGGVMSTRCV